MVSKEIQTDLKEPFHVANSIVHREYRQNIAFFDSGVSSWYHEFLALLNQPDPRRIWQFSVPNCFPSDRGRAKHLGFDCFRLAICDGVDGPNAPVADIAQN